MELLIRIGQLFLSLTLLVLLHELGHFLTAKYFKTRVDKFYIFFNPWFSLFKIKKGETEYGIGWLPIGGYVKIAGMIDESMDKEQMQQPPQPDEFRSKKSWQRLIIITAGVVVNFVLAFLIYTGISYKWGDTYLANDSLKYGVVVNANAHSIGLRNGDKILFIDNEKPERFNNIIPDIITKNAKEITVLRNNTDTITIAIPKTFRREILSESSKSFNFEPILEPRISFSPFVIAKVKTESIADIAGLKSGDEIISIDNNNFHFYDEFQSYLKEHTNSTIQVQVKRSNEIKTIDIALTNAPVLGVYLDMSNRESLEFTRYTYSFYESIIQGWNKLLNTIEVQINSIKLLFTKEGASSVGGIGTMSQVFPTFWNWEIFWNITAMFSAMFAVLNILPIPGLDGGHTIFILYEMITRRKPNQRFMEIVQMIGVLFLISLIILVNVNDVLKFLR